MSTIERRTVASEGAAAAGGLHHLGLLYHDRTQYLTGAGGFVRAAVAAGDPVLVAVPGTRLEVLRDGLSDVADRVRFVDMVVVGRNPGRIIPAVLLAFADAHRGRRAWIVGEPIWPGRTPVEYPACVTHEALINTVFADRDVRVLCPYDAGNLDAEALADAGRTHPVLVEDDRRWRSGSYTDPLRLAGLFNRPLPAPPVDAAVFDFAGEGALATLRQFVVAYAAAWLSADRLDDLVIAVNELAANTVEHGGGAGRLSLWAEAGRLSCQIDDAGQLTDPLAGRIPAAPGAEGGRGLLLANQLCDLVRVHSAGTGTSILLHLES